MATQLGSSQTMINLVAAPGVTVALSPTTANAVQGAKVPITVTAMPINDFAGAIYLRVGNWSVDPRLAFSVNPVPAGGGTSVLTIDTTGLPEGALPVSIEAWDALP